MGWIKPVGGESVFGPPDEHFLVGNFQLDHFMGDYMLLVEKMNLFLGHWVTVKYKTENKANMYLVPKTTFESTLVRNNCKIM